MGVGEDNIKKKKTHTHLGCRPVELIAPSVPWVILRRNATLNKSFYSFAGTRPRHWKTIIWRRNSGPISSWARRNPYETYNTHGKRYNTISFVVRRYNTISLVVQRPHTDRKPSRSGAGGLSRRGLAVPNSGLFGRQKVGWVVRAEEKSRVRAPRSLWRYAKQ